MVLSPIAFSHYHRFQGCHPVLKYFKKNLEWLNSRKKSHSKGEYESTIRGREAEIKVLEALQNLGDGEWNLFHRKRIPRPESHRGKGEIDIIAVGVNAVLAIEVKNWSGLVSLQGDEFYFQNIRKTKRRNRKRPAVSRGKVAEKISTKVKDFESVYRGQYKSAVDFDIFPIIVFSGKDNTLSEEISRRDDCWSIDDLEQMHEKLISTIKPISREKRAKIIYLISEFGTWDEVKYSGGMLLEGDISDVSGVSDLEGNQLTRDAGLKVNIESPRGNLTTILLGPKINAKITDNSGNKSDILLNPSCKLNVSLPSGKRTQIPIEQISYFAYGHEGIEPWRKERNTRSEQIEAGKIERSKEKNFFEEGKGVTGTTRQWSEHGLWVNLDIKGVDGLLPNNQFPNLEISKLMFTPGKEIPVIMNNISKKGIIYLRYDEDQE